MVFKFRTVCVVLGINSVAIGSLKRGQIHQSLCQGILDRTPKAFNIFQRAGKGSFLQLGGENTLSNFCSMLNPCEDSLASRVFSIEYRSSLTFIHEPKTRESYASIAAQTYRATGGITFKQDQ